MTVTAPQEEGVYRFPTIQTYADREEAAWIGEPGTDHPAPRIQVGDETAEVERSGEVTPHTDPAAETTAEASPEESPPAEVEAPAPRVERDLSPLLMGVGLALLVTFGVAVLIARRRR